MLAARFPGSQRWAAATYRRRQGSLHDAAVTESDDIVGMEGSAIARRRHVATAPLPLLVATPDGVGGSIIRPERYDPIVATELSSARAAVRSFQLYEARDHVENALRTAPSSFTAHAMHGEVLYRIGLYKEASAALFTALMLPPTSWQNYQLVNHLYQESRDSERGSFIRRTDVPPPRPVEFVIRAVAHRLRFLARFRRLEAIL